MSNPTSSVDEHPLDDLAAYALAALDDAEREAIDDHLARCARCRDELADHHETLAALTAGEEAPPAGIWQRVAAGIGTPDLPDPHTATGADSSQPPPAGPGAVTSPGSAASPNPDIDERSPEHQARRGRHELGGAVAPLAGTARGRIWRPSRVQWLAAAACLLVATATGGVVGFVLGRSGDDADISNLAQEAAQDPGAVLGTLADTGGRPVARVVTDEDGAYLVLQGLQTLPEGQAYQLWSLSGPQPVSLGMLGRDGTNTVAFRLPPTIDQLAISVEPTQGQVAPTTDFQALGRITPRT